MLSKFPGEISMSSYAQELSCYVGQQMVFAEASDLLDVMKGLDINAKQIERICHIYGGHLEEQEEKRIAKEEVKEYSPSQKEDIHYAMMDGGMFLTREEGWKEVKLGRIFSQKDSIKTSKNRGLITETTYLAHLGSHNDFFSKLDYHLEKLPNPVFISDGAKWIWNRIDDCYPDSIQILDFFHAYEHLCDFAKEFFPCKDKRDAWTEKQKELLLNDKVKEVIENIDALDTSKGKKLQEIQRKLINYYRKNKKRMQYKTFTNKGLLIGSGAIESAIRSVLQQRMKLSGQRWTMQGFQKVANLRVAYKSNNWKEVTNFAKMAA